MKLGIKVGPQKTSISDLEATHAPFAEVYFDFHRLNEYFELFNYLKIHQIETGLHYWATFNDNICSNISYPDPDILKQSRQLIQKTIDLAETHGFQYVNIHPGSRSLVRFDMTKQTFELMTKPIAINQSTDLFLESAVRLDAYAKSKNVVLTIETVPVRVTNGYWIKPRNEQIPINVNELPLEALFIAKEKGLNIANDFGHTAASIITDDLPQIWKRLYNSTVYLASQTKLIHLGFITKPFCGTDFHDSLTNPVLETDQAIPNKNQMIELLKLFPKNQKIWILVEPNASHIENYFAAKKILDIAGVMDL